MSTRDIFLRLHLLRTEIFMDPRLLIPLD